MNLENVEVGLSYKISWDDCCTAGRFTSTVTRIDYHLPPDENMILSITFNNGVVMEQPFYGVEVVPS